MSKDTAGVILAKTVEQTASSVNNVVQSVSHSESVQSLDNALAQMITSVVGGIKEGVSFVQGQLPDVIMQLIVYNRVLLTSAVIFGLLLIYVTKRCSSKLAVAWEDCDEGTTVLWLFSTIATGLASFAFIFGNIADCIKIWFAPEVWLIEYAADLIKKVN